MSVVSQFFPIIPECGQVSVYATTCRHVVTMMTGNPAFPDPAPPLMQLTTDLNALEAAEQLAQKGGKGMVQERDAALRTVKRGMRRQVAYVWSVVDEHPGDAEALILSAGLAVGKRTTRQKPLFSAKRGKVSGSAVLEAKALRGPVQYQWQKSEDQVTWTDLPHTFVSSTSVQGLTLLKVYAFRFRALTKLGLSEWSDAVSLLVL